MNTQKITLTRVTRLTEDKNGSPLTTRDGRPYVRLLINCNEYGDKPLSGFGNKDNAHWKEGDVIEVKIEKKQVGDNEYLNFETQKKDDKLEATLGFMNHKLDYIIELLREAKGDTVPYPESTGEPKI